MNFGVLALAAVLNLYIQSPAFAADVTSTSSSTATSGYDLRSHLDFRYKGEFYGPAITEMGGYRPNLVTGAAENKKDPIRLENKLNFAYLLDSDWSTGVSVEFNELAYQGMQMKDPYAMIRNSHLLRQGEFNLDAQARAYAGVTDASKAVDQYSSIRVVLDPTYRIAGTPWSFSGYVYGQRFLYGKEPKTGTMDTRFFFNPSVRYRLTSTVVASVQYKAYANHRTGKDRTDLNSEPTNVGPALSWDPYNFLNLVGYVDLSPGTGFAANNTSIGMNLALRLL